MKRSRLLALFLWILLSSASALVAQTTPTDKAPAKTQEKEKDPFSMDPIDRPSASTPLTYGLILNAAYPVFGAVLSDENQEASKDLAFEAQAYVDTWQFGFSRRVYADVFQLTFRSAGRDSYSGWYIERGADEDSVQVFGNTGEPEMLAVGRTFWGVGMRSQSGYKGDISVTYLSNLTFGYYSYDDDVYDAGFYFNYGLGIGGRFALPFGALGLNALGELALVPAQNTDPAFFIRLSIGAMFALNLQAD